MSCRLTGNIQVANAPKVMDVHVYCRSSTDMPSVTIVLLRRGDDSSEL